MHKYIPKHTSTCSHLNYVFLEAIYHLINCFNYHLLKGMSAQMSIICICIKMRALSTVLSTETHTTVKSARQAHFFALPSNNRSRTDIDCCIYKSATTCICRWKFPCTSKEKKIQTTTTSTNGNRSSRYVYEEDETVTREHYCTCL